MGLVPKGDQPTPLWFGSGFHFALEDFHGYRTFADPKEALAAYAKAHRSSELPQDSEETLELGYAMLDHYINWLKTRDTFRTLWLPVEDPETGETRRVPQVEVNFAIPLGEIGGQHYHYGGTFDRIVVDEDGRYWILDYKTAARFDTSKLEMDPQVSAYCWAAERLYPGLHFEGMVYQQHLKAAPAPPRKLVNGDFSVDKRQNTTYRLFRKALIEAGFKRATGKYLEYLNFLATQESVDGDKFIRRDLVRRNDAQKRAAHEQIVAELREMALRDLPLYPNPTKDCVWDCQFRAPCIALDDGSDWEYLIEENYETRVERGSWRQRMQDQQDYQVAVESDDEHLIAPYRQ
jgi:RecB family exonuclease